MHRPARSYAFLALAAILASTSSCREQPPVADINSTVPEISSPKTLPTGDTNRFVAPDAEVEAFVKIVSEVPSIRALDNWSERRSTVAWRDVYADGSTVFVYAILTAEGCTFVVEASPTPEASRVDLTEESTAQCNSVPDAKPKIHVRISSSKDFTLAIVDWRLEPDDGKAILASLSLLDWAPLAKP